jgi:hypothetical protein
MFIGPSTPCSPQATTALTNYELCPPIKRGDLRTMVAERPAGQVVIVDGLFYHSFAVDHRELADAAGSGWDIVGMSSMGALRAAEMSAHGVTGFGAVFRLVLHPGLDDDELMLLHDQEPPFRAATVPLVEIRAGLGALVATGRCTERLACHVIDGLRNMWFGARSWGVVEHLILDHAEGTTELVSALRTTTDPSASIKRLDVERYVLGQPEPTASLSSCGTIVVHEPETIASAGGVRAN